MLVPLVRNTEKQLLQLGRQVVPLALSAQLCLAEAEPLSEEQHVRLNAKLQAAPDAHRTIERQARRLTQGKAVGHCKIVNAYDITIAPIQKGKSNRPAQFGRKPGIIAEMASGVIFGVHLPVGNPSDASYVLPLVHKVERVLNERDWGAGQERPRIRSIAGDLGMRDPDVKAALQRRGILTVGIPDSVVPFPNVPPDEMIEAVLTHPEWQGHCDRTQVEIAYACGYSRPFVEGMIEGLVCRGGAHITYKGHRGAIVQTEMTILASNAAVLVRIRQNRLTKRAQTFRQWFGLTPSNSQQDNASKN